MLQQQVRAEDIRDVLLAHSDAGAVHFFCPTALDQRLAEFRRGFPGLVTFAVKSNPQDAVITRLCQGGIDGFDVASPDEIAQVSRLCPGRPMHYNNPVRSRAEIRAGIAAGVVSWSIDTLSELQKLIDAGIADDAEVAVRFKLPVAGAAYHFGAKFGATEEEAVDLLRAVGASGRRPAITFHVGTQCADPQAWVAYIQAAARIERAAGVRCLRLNVGGGFPSARHGAAPLEPFFAAIRGAMSAFDTRPVLVCEPGRGLVADAFALAVQVKSIRGQAIYLTDGIYGGLSEMVNLAAPALAVLSAEGVWRNGPVIERPAFGPTCDSLDLLKHPLPLPATIAEGDWIVLRSMGAYVTGVTTRFNGYGDVAAVTVSLLDAPYAVTGQA